MSDTLDLLANNEPFASIDPGVRHCGLVVWKNKQLFSAKLIRETKKLNGPELRKSLSSKVWFELHSQGVENLWIEKPQAYQRRFQKGDQNDLIDLAITVGRLSASATGHVVECFPREWKGQTPKEVTRIRCIEKLSPYEMVNIDLPKAKKLQLDVWDAIGIGLWALKR